MKNESELKLENDTYAMAFKALSWQVIRELDLD